MRPNLDTQLANEAALLLFESGKLQGSIFLICLLILPFQGVASVSMRKTEINVKFKLNTFTSRLCSAA